MKSPSGTPIIREMQVIPVAGYDSMLLNLCGAHAPYFTRTIVILKDSLGNTGLGEVPGGEGIRQTLDKAIPLVVGQSIGLNGSSAVIWKDAVATDLNRLTMPGSLHLIYANDINNGGRITGQASDPAARQSPAFWAVPSPGVNHCSAAASVPRTNAAATSIILPTNIAAMLWRSGALSRFGLGR